MLTALGARARTRGRWSSSRSRSALCAALFLGWFVVCATPAVSAVSAIRAGWIAVGDSAGIAAYTSDTFSTDPPLVGMPTSLPLTDGETVYHLGPLGFWTLALPTRLLGAPGHGLVIGSATVSVLSIIGTAVLVRRWPPLAQAILLLLIAAMVARLGSNLLADPFNPHLGLLPLLLFLVAACSATAGHLRNLPVAVVAGSFAAQVHAGYVPLVGAVGAVAALASAYDIRRCACETRPRRVLPVCLVLGALLWLGPAIDQIAGHGNITRAIQAQGEGGATLGWAHGLDLLVDMTSLPPRWMIERAESGPVPEASGSRTILSTVVIASTVAVTAWAIGTRRRMLAAMGLVSITGLAAATWASSRIHVDYFSSRLLFYRLFWWPLGVLLVATLCCGIAVALGGAFRRNPDRSPTQPSWVPIALAVASAAVAASGLQLTEPGVWSLVGAPEIHAEAVHNLSSRPDSVALSFSRTEGPPGWTADALTFVGQLRLRNIGVRFTDETLTGVIAPPLRAYRADNPATGTEDIQVLFIAGSEAAAPPPAGYELLSRIPTVGGGDDAAVGEVHSAVYIRAG
jgi:hypothetical protein